MNIWIFTHPLINLAGTIYIHHILIIIVIFENKHDESIHIKPIHVINQVE